MTKQNIIEKTVHIINLLPKEKAEEIFDFADFLMKKQEEQNLVQQMGYIVAESSSFEFLKNEEDLYTENDLKEIFNDQGWYCSG